MWFLFVVPLALFGAGTAMLGMVNAGTIVVITVAADQWQRSRGYKPGEGVFTDREGGHVFGLRLAKEALENDPENDPENASSLELFLVGMSKAFPDMFGAFVGKSFDLTASEGEFLRSMVRAAEGQLNEYKDLASELRDDEEEDETELLAELSFRKEQLVAALSPIVLYLKNVPGTRVRSAT